LALEQAAGGCARIAPASLAQTTTTLRQMSVSIRQEDASETRSRARHTRAALLRS